MKKLMLFTILVILFINSKAQDTTCTVVTVNKIYEFQYRPTKLFDKRDYEGYVYLEVKENEVLALHLYDKEEKFRKIFVYYPFNEGETQKVKTYTLESKSNVYFFNGPKEIAILTQTSAK